MLAMINSYINISVLTAETALLFRITKLAKPLWSVPNLRQYLSFPCPWKVGP